MEDTAEFQCNHFNIHEAQISGEGILRMKSESVQYWVILFYYLEENVILSYLVE